MNEFFPPFHWTNLLIIPGLLIGYTIHELAHAFTAYFLGDYSQVERGKITLNPTRHISWFGAFTFILFGFGWPKQMETNPSYLKHRYLDLFFIALAGPLASFTFSLASMLLTLLIAASLVYLSGVSTDEILQFLFPLAQNLPQTLDLQAWSIALTSRLAVASFWLTLTSILPLPGLDGFVMVVSLIAFFKERRQASQAQHRPISSPEIKPSGPINRHQRRDNISDIHFKLGTEYHEAGQYEDAIARYRQAINIDRQFGPAYVNLGLAYLGLGRRREAIHAFRGAIQFADDQKSKNEAWYQLHQLSEVSHLDEQAKVELAEIGASPWTDIKPHPNWLSLAVGVSFLLVCAIFGYGYLLSSLVEQLSA